MIRDGAYNPSTQEVEVGRIAATEIHSEFQISVGYSVRDPVSTNNSLRAHFVSISC